MGVTLREKAELVVYQLKGFAQVWYNQWKEIKSVGAGPIEWEMFKFAFLDRFFPFEMRQTKVLEFISLCQRSMSVKEYALKFTQLSKYAPTMVANSRVRMKEKLKEKSREVKRAKNDDGDFSHARSGGQGRPKSRQGFSCQGSSNASPKFNNDRVSNPKPQGGNGGGSSLARSTCTKCGKNHDCKCLAGTNGCFSCGKSGHKMRDCPMLTAKEREGTQAPPSGLNSNASKKNRCYALQTRGDQESSPNVVTGMLRGFKLDVYVLLDPGATLSFVTSYVSMKFDVLPDVMLEPFSVSTSIGDSVVAKKVYSIELLSLT
ncbi:uncharacterized protein LOC125828397 [Solanum verrucosum]|uniref:uncharacterized protein LOC125828397 n=1 Tax=Solanum verrucosum TaxID=315347 RepID=UPI0020D182E4|nr:uncharacterized protein LOC125828397 [Solanum verrucosum]